MPGLGAVVTNIDAAPSGTLSSLAICIPIAVFRGYLVSPSWSAVVREMKLSLQPESSSAPTLVFNISTGTYISLPWAVNGGVSRSSGSIDATNLPRGMLIGLGPTRGAGFSGLLLHTVTGVHGHGLLMHFFHGFGHLLGHGHGPGVRGTG